MRGITQRSPEECIQGISDLILNILNTYAVQVISPGAVRCKISAGQLKVKTPASELSITQRSPAECIQGISDLILNILNTYAV